MSAVPISKPYIETRPQLRVVPGTGPSVATQVLRGVVAYGVITLAVFGASSLTGHVMVEKARREGIRANQRLVAATAAQVVLTKQIEALSDEKDLEQWATRNGFVAPTSGTQTSSKNVVVALR